MKFLMGKKIEMTQIFTEDGQAVAVTKVQAGPCTVVQIKSDEKDGYSAVQFGYGEKKEKNINKPQLGHMKGLGNFRYLRELRIKPSSAKATADKGGVGDLLLQQIDLAYNLHEVRHVILMHHNDCGAYLNSYQFENEKAEKEKQFEDMKKAKKIIEERYLGVEVVLVWAELQDEDGEQIEFQEM